MLSNFTDWKQWHHRQIKWRQQARKTSGEEQSFRGLGIWNKVICQHWCWGYLLKILLKWKQGTYEVPAIETGLLGELHPVLLQTHQKAADVKYQRSPPASWLWSGLKRSFEMNIMGTTNWNIIDLQIPIVNIAIEIYILYVCIMSANQILGIKTRKMFHQLQLVPPIVQPIIFFGPSIIPALLNDEQAPTKNKARTVQNWK